MERFKLCWPTLLITVINSTASSLFVCKELPMLLCCCHCDWDLQLPSALPGVAEVGRIVWDTLRFVFFPFPSASSVSEKSVSNPLLFCKQLLGSSLSLQNSSLMPASWWEQLFSCHVVTREVSARSLLIPAECLAFQTSWCLCLPGISLLTSGLWPTSVHKNRQWFWEVQGHKIVPPIQEKNPTFYSWLWICVFVGLFWFGFFFSDCFKVSD